MARKRLNKKVALVGSAFFVVLVLAAIGGILYLSRDPEKFIKDGDLAVKAAREATDKEIKEQEYKKAQRSYRKAIGLARDDLLKTDILFKLADMYIETDQWPEVRGCWAGVIQIDPGNARARFGGLKYLYIMADGGVRAAWQEVANQASEFLDLADAEVLSEDTRQWDCFELQTDAAAQKLGAWLYLVKGRALLEMAKQGLVTDADDALVQAVDDLEKARDLEPTDIQAYLYLAQSAIAKGEVQVLRGDLEERDKAANRALEFLQEAVKAAGDNPRAHISLLQIRRMIAGRQGPEDVEALEAEYVKLTEMFPSSAEVFVFLAGLYLPDVKKIDKTLAAVEKAFELDSENVSYAISAADLYYRRFCFYGRPADLYKAMEIANAALELRGAQEEGGGPREQAHRMNRILLYDFLANCYIEQVLEPRQARTEAQKRQWLTKAEQVVHEIEQLVGSGEAPQVVKWQGMLELAKADEGDRNAAVRKLYTVYEQLKASAIEDAPPSYLRRSYAQLSYALGKVFEDTVEVGATAGFLASALNAGIMSTKPEAVLDHAEALMKLGYWSEVVSDINAFEETFGANPRSQTLRIRTLIATKQLDEAEKELARIQLDEPNEIGLRLVLVRVRIRQVQVDRAREQLKEGSDIAAPLSTVGEEVVELERGQLEAADELMAAELKDYMRNLAELVDKLLSAEPNSVEEVYVGIVCRNYIADGQTDRARDLINRFLEFSPDNVTALVYKQVLSEPEPAKISQERLNEIGEQVRSNITEPLSRALHLGMFYYERNELDKAAAEFEKFLKKEPLQEEEGRAEMAHLPEPTADKRFEDVDVRRLIVSRVFDIALRTEDWELAEEMVEFAGSEDMDECGGRFFAARCAAAKGNFQEALTKLDECLKERPIFSGGYLLRSRVNTALGNEDLAVEDVRRAASLNPPSSGIAKELALALYRRNERLGQNVSSDQIIEVRAALEHAMALNPGEPGLPSLYAEFISATEPGRALAIRQRLHKINPSVENTLLLGRMAMRMAVGMADGKQREFLLATAASAFEQALAVEPENKTVLDSFAQYYRLIGQGEKAEALLAESEDPKLRWRDYFRSGQFDKARQIVEELLKAEPNDTASLKGLLLVAEKTGDEETLKKYSQDLLELEDTVENRLFQVQSFLGVGLVKEAEYKLQGLREKFPDEPRAMLLEAQLVTRQGQMEKALELINRSLEIDQDSALAWQIRGEINRLTANYERAIIDLKRSKSLSDSPLTRVVLAKAYIQAGREEDAVTELRNTIDNPQAPAEARQLLERIYHRSDRKPELRRFYKQTLDRLPQSAYWRARAGAFAVAEGDFKQAEQLYAEAWQLSQQGRSGDATVLDGYLQALMLAEKLDKVFEVASKYVDGRFAAVAYLRMAGAKLKLGDEPGAIKYYRKALEKAHADGLFAAYVLQGMYSMLGAEGAMRICRERLAAAPGSVAANLSMFELMTMSGQYNKALDYIDRCLEIERSSPGTNGREVDFIAKKTGVLQLAYARTSDNNYLRQAVREYESLLAKMPNNTSVLNNLAYMLAEEDIRLGEALEYAERAHSRQPNNPDFMDTYAYVLCKSGRFAEAASLLRSAVQQYEARRLRVPAEVYEHLGQVSEKLGAADEALSAYKEALEVGADTLSEQTRERINKAVDSLISQSRD